MKSCDENAQCSACLRSGRGPAWKRLFFSGSVFGLLSALVPATAGHWTFVKVAQPLIYSSFGSFEPGGAPSPPSDIAMQAEGLPLSTNLLTLEIYGPPSNYWFGHEISFRGGQAQFVDIGSDQLSASIQDSFEVEYVFAPGSGSLPNPGATTAFGYGLREWSANLNFKFLQSNDGWSISPNSFGIRDMYCGVQDIGIPDAQFVQSYGVFNNYRSIDVQGAQFDTSPYSWPLSEAPSFSAGTIVGNIFESGGKYYCDLDFVGAPQANGLATITIIPFNSPVYGKNGGGFTLWEEFAPALIDGYPVQ